MKDSISSKVFNKTFHNSEIISNDGLVFYSSRSTFKKIGFIVSKGYGPSRERNLFKRRVRAICRQSSYNGGLTVIVRPTQSNYSYKQLKKAFDVFFHRLNN